MGARCPWAWAGLGWVDGWMAKNGVSIYRSRPWEYQKNQTDGKEADNKIRRHTDE